MKPGRRRAEHEAGDEVAVAAPQQLRDRAAHRVADGDHGPGAELDQRGRAVVGAVGEAEHAPASGCPARGRAGRARSPGSARRACRRPGTSSGRRWRPSRAAAGRSARPAGPGISRTKVVPRRGSSSAAAGREDRAGPVAGCPSDRGAVDCERAARAHRSVLLESTRPCVAPTMLTQTVSKCQLS